MQSRKPPPLPSKLIKSDPDSATSPSKYSGSSPVPDPALSANQDSSDSNVASAADQNAKRKLLRKKKKRKAATTTESSSANAPASKNAANSEEQHGFVISKQAQEQAERELLSNKKVWSQNRDLLNRDIQKFLHKSKANFAVDDVKHAMDQARIIARTESVTDYDEG